MGDRAWAAWGWGGSGARFLARWWTQRTDESLASYRDRYAGAFGFVGDVCDAQLLILYALYPQGYHPPGEDEMSLAWAFGVAPGEVQRVGAPDEVGGSYERAITGGCLCLARNGVGCTGNCLGPRRLSNVERAEALGKIRMDRMRREREKRTPRDAEAWWLNVLRRRDAARRAARNGASDE